ncbi:Ig-like domain-containing protein [Aliiglaciecola sp. LCG003]|uniref:Ig-like domain-containing protein n=1 Tax=Aliiglaciecola sp. LCG003 TaxID=3053655 RepID=UPI002572C65D|nr:Ig-like domain-containing protein [Aliiglaciecola sp. LCG003]WJG07788.1 Ig-like domain-containing protein [Aliiglaciecola sp. LCG003]
MTSRFRILITCFLLLAVAACGGGGSVERDSTGGGTGGGTTDPTYNVSLSIAGQNGEATNLLSSTSPLSVTATVSSTDGGNVADQLVTFSFSQTGLATFSNDTGTALTNADGIATIGLLVGASSGDSLVLGALDSGVQGQVGFSSAGSTNTGSTPASLELFANSTQLASSGSDEIELIAVVKNAQNILLEGVDVSFAANNAAELQIVQGTSAADGTARALLTSRNNPENRVVTATVSSGTFSQTVDIQIVGTEVNVDGPSSVVLGDTIDVTIKVADSDGNGLANREVSLTTSQGTIDSSATTDAEGQVTVQYQASQTGSNTITASALNAQGSLVFTVQEDSFSFTTIPVQDVPLSTNTTLQVTWLKDNVAFVGGTVTLSSSRGTIVAPTTVTDANGVASFTIQSNNAGLTSITAEGVDGNGQTVSSRTQFEFIAITPATILVDASPDLIGPEGQTSTISAIVRDASGNLVKGQVVNFRVDDVSGGFVLPNSSTTDSNGIASTVYTSNAVSSEDAVMVHADVANNTSVSNFTTLTVGDRAFDISLGTGNSLEAPDESSYLKQFSVFVSDAAGRPVSNVQLTASSTPIKRAVGGVYRKGFWSYNIDLDVWVGNITATCPNEDINANGSLDAGEDTNGDGRLTPGIVGTISFEDDVNSTDVNGQAKLEIRYPKSYAFWTDVEISVFGQSSGSESLESQSFRLSAAVADLDDEASEPPSNPFGSSSFCTDPD